MVNRCRAFPLPLYFHRLLQNQNHKIHTTNRYSLADRRIVPPNWIAIHCHSVGYTQASHEPICFQLGRYEMIHVASHFQHYSKPIRIATAICNRRDSYSAAVNCLCSKFEAADTIHVRLVECQLLNSFLKKYYRQMQFSCHLLQLKSGSDHRLAFHLYHRVPRSRNFNLFEN